MVKRNKKFDNDRIDLLAQNKNLKRECKNLKALEQ